MDPDPVFRGGNPIFHSQQHICGHVQEHGHAERHAGSVYQPAVSALGHKASVEPFCRHNPDKKMVDHIHAGSYVRGYDASPVHAAEG